MDTQNNLSYIKNPFASKKRGGKEITRNKGKYIKIILVAVYLITCIILLSKMFTMKSKVNTLRQTNTKKTNEINELKESNQILYKKVESESKDAKQLEKEKKDIDNEINKLNEELSELKKEDEKSGAKQLEILKSKLKDLKEDESDYNNNIQLLLTQLNNSENLLKKKKDKLTLLEETLKKLQEGDNPKPKPVDYEFDSKICPNKEQLKDIATLLEMTINITTKLLYRASTDGFTPSEMHKRIDNEKNLLILVLTVDNQVIGGFSSNSFDSVQPTFKSDEYARIFNLNTKKLYLIRNKNEAIYCDQMYFTIFGKGDLGVGLDGTIRSGFPVSYGSGLEPKCEILNGNDIIKISEFEVFHVIALSN